MNEQIKKILDSCERELNINNPSSKRIVVGMSGGVDSSATALILKELGFDVVGIFMKNWEEEIDGVCSSAKDYSDVEKVCKQLAIQYYAVEFVKEYRDQVFSEFIREYENGNTPNPDILCNREIKFKVFYEKAISFGADFLATGHYARKIVVNSESTADNGTQTIKEKEYQLHKGSDPGKDQSYFLYTMKENVLKNVLFPIGNLLKKDVRLIAKHCNLATHAKKDSTGICFIGERDFREFLSKFIALKPGEFKRLSGEVVGRHQGSAYYTIGQRKGLGLGGPGEPWFVIKKDVKKNIVYVERGENHPALYANSLEAFDLSLVNERAANAYDLFLNNSFKDLKAKIRYRQTDQACSILNPSNNNIECTPNGFTVIFPEDQRAITPRQSIVFYSNNRCLGGAIIK